MIPFSEDAAIVAAYQGGDGYETIARRFKTSSSRVAVIMKKHAPDSIRPSGNPAGKHGNPLDGGLTLSALSLYAVGPCADCGVPLVSPTRERRQACGFCQIARMAA